MTIPGELRSDRAEHLASLLPAHVMARDAQTGGLLRELLGAVAGELALVEQDLERLYDSWFVETADEWVLPYLADLVGLVGLPGDLGPRSGASRRAVVANTVSYRQRKGTVAVLEQLVRDVTGWPSRAVEHHALLGTTTHVNHVRLDRPAWGSVRDAATAELESPALAAGALTSRAHTAEARSIDPRPARGRGRYGIRDLGVFVFTTQVCHAPGAAARQLSANGPWSTHPLGLEQPLFAAPVPEETIEHRASEADLPVPLRPRRLLAALVAARAGTAGEPVPLVVRVDAGDALPPERIRVCGLETLLTDGGGPLAGWQVMVDTVHGIVHPYFDGAAAAPAELQVDHDYGAAADVGAGTYDRTLGHLEALAGAPDDEDADAGRDRIAAQTAVLTVAPVAGAPTTLAAGLADVAAAWAQTDPAENGPGGTQVLSIGDSEAYVEDASIDVPERRRLVVVAAAWRGRRLLDGDEQAPVPGVYAPDGVRPRITGTVEITGGRGSAVLLDGLVIEGDVVVRPGSLRSLTVSQCTVAGVVRVESAAGLGNRELIVALRRSMAGGFDLADTVPVLTIEDSIVDPRFADLAGTGILPPAVGAPAGNVEIDGSTLFGDVSARLLSVSSSICDGKVTVVDRQRGCARYSFFGPESETPRRYRCVPASDAEPTSDAPSYRATDLGSPWYASLSASTPASIRRGGESGAEMGVHHHLRRPQRMDAAHSLVEPYVPAGMDLGLFWS